MKKQLRKTMKELRAALPPQAREEAAFRVLQALQSLPEFQRAETLFCYASVGAELLTAAIAAAHQRVAYPKVLGEGEMRFYCGPLQAGFRGIPEPIGEEEVIPKKNDLMLLPALAFGEDGSRLGYGGGYYDRYLAACVERPICCGIGYEEQVLSFLPDEPHDQRMDLLITPMKIRRFH